MAAIVYGLLISLVLMVVTVRATTHLVGDNSGWSPTTNLHGWGSGNTFTVGDILVFNYGPTHAVQVVTKNDYSNCNTDNPISSHSGGKTTISLDKAGPAYFICPTAGHCQAGMKLSINVVTGDSGSGSSSGSVGSGSNPGTATSPPSIPVRDPHRPPSPPMGGFPSPTGGLPSPPGGIPTNPIGGIGWPNTGWGQVTYHGAAHENLNGGLAVWFSLAVAALVGVMV